MRDENLQKLFREYMSRLRYLAKKHGLLHWLDGVIKDNRDRRCEATRKEVEMLSRLLDDERVHRGDIPKILGKTYRQCVIDGDFRAISRLRSVGTYGKTDVLLRKRKTTKQKKYGKRR